MANNAPQSVDPTNSLLPTDDELSIFKEYINTLSPYQQFILKQYTHHGDVIINSLLRGIDTIDTYRNNIYNPMMINTTGTFFCLYLGEFDHEYELNRYNTRKYHSIPTDYTDVIYPQLKAKLDANDLDYFRRTTYKIIKDLYTIIKNAPSIGRVFTTYRAVKTFYLDKNPRKISKLNSFHSTTVAIHTLLGFVMTPNFLSEFTGNISNLRRGIGVPQYIFKVHPDCVYMYMEPITLHTDEYEILLAPGNRYLFISEEGTTQTYAVLPPEPGYELQDTYEEYMEYLKTSQEENRLHEENRTELGRIRGLMSGGTRKRKSSKRITRLKSI